LDGRGNCANFIGRLGGRRARGRGPSCKNRSRKEMGEKQKGGDKKKLECRWVKEKRKNGSFSKKTLEVEEERITNGRKNWAQWGRES